MSGSPFASFTNAVLRFQVAAGNLGMDGKGNLRPSTAVIEVTAMLEQASQQSQKAQIEPLPGADSMKYCLEGFAIAPMRLPSVVAPNCPCQAIWNDISGEFFLEPIARSPWEYERITGDELRGWFVPSSLIVDGEPWEPPTPEPPPAGNSNQKNELPAAVNLSALRLVAVNDVGQLVYASSDNPEHANRVVGLTLAATSAGAIAQILTDGRYQDNSWNWVVGAPIFAGIDGFLTQAPQQDEGFLLRCATVVSPTEIDFEIQEPILL